MTSITNAPPKKSSSPQPGKNLKRSLSEMSSARSSSDRGGIDTHPYMRGSVIEVIYGGVRKVEHSDLEEDYLDEDYNEDEDDDNADDDDDIQHINSEKLSEVRLADIIDRAPSDTPNHEDPAFRYKYYIHYRDYNRRMDEWIADPHRIVSPPSVGNAKVREMKKAKAKAAKEEEERKNRERGNAFLEEGSSRRKNANTALDGQSISPGGRATSQRLSSRRATAAISGTSVSASAVTNSTSASSNSNAKKNKTEDGKSNLSSSNAQSFPSANASTVGLEDTEQLRLTRRQRRKVRSQTTEESEPSLPEKSTVRQNVITTLLPGQDDIKDKVVTVAARELDEHEGLDEASLREHEEVTKVKNVAEVQLGRYKMNAWYFSPLPKELLQNGNTVDILYVCEFTLKFFSRKEELIRFQAKHLATNQRHPPGNEIYRNGKLSMFEIDGFEERMYCQNLCYIAKLFLDHKTLYFDVDPFLFYVLCEVDERGFHPVGYYSKEKYSDVGFNLACILTFPCHQRKGYGRFLIDFSYELSKKEEKVGSPEKPMSDLGQQAYKPYWTSTIVDFLLNQCDLGSMSIMEISKKTSIMAEDIIFTLNVLGLLKYINGVYFITAEKNLLQQLAKKHPLKEPRVDPSKLHWCRFTVDIKRDKFSIHSKKPSIEGGNNT